MPVYLLVNGSRMIFHSLHRHQVVYKLFECLSDRTESWEENCSQFESGGDVMLDILTQWHNLKFQAFDKITWSHDLDKIRSDMEELYRVEPSAFENDSFWMEYDLTKEWQIISFDYIGNPRYAVYYYYDNLYNHNDSKGHMINFFETYREASSQFLMHAKYQEPTNEDLHYILLYNSTDEELEMLCDKHKDSYNRALINLEIPIRIKPIR